MDGSQRRRPAAEGPAMDMETKAVPHRHMDEGRRKEPHISMTAVERLDVGIRQGGHRRTWEAAN